MFKNADLNNCVWIGAGKKSFPVDILTEIILNKDRLPYLFIDGKCYCLLKESNLINDKMSFYDITFEKVRIDNNLRRLIRFPWTNLWAKKLDYLENILNHLELSYKSVLPICLYFMGLGENARINVPGKMLKENWSWRLKSFKEVEKEVEYFGKI